MLGRPHPKVKFTQREDEQLKHVVGDLGSDDWETVAQQMTGRSPRQCRERWTFYLSPEIVNSVWTEDEDVRLLQKYAEVGPFWTRIAASFPSRTPISVKSRWNLIQRRNKKRANGQSLLGIRRFGIPGLARTKAPPDPKEATTLQVDMASNATPPTGHSLDNETGETWPPEEDRIWESDVLEIDDPLGYEAGCWFLG
jgi:hypothetical protein